MKELELRILDALQVLELIEKLSEEKPNAKNNEQIGALARMLKEYILFDK